MTLTLFLLLISAISLGIIAFSINVKTGRVNLLALGLFAFVLVPLIPMLQKLWSK